MQKKIRILSQKHTPQKYTIGTHKQRLRWLLAASTIPLLGIVTAFGIAPYTLPVSVPVIAISQDIPMPQLAVGETVGDDATPLWHLDQVQRGDTLSSVLTRLNILNAEAIAYLRQAPDARALASQLVPGRTLLAQTTPQGDLLELQFQLDTGTALTIKKTAGGYSAQTLPMALEKRVVMKSAEIDTSLFAATDDAGIPDPIATKIADIFSSDIDFNQDLRKGDHFTVVYEAAYDHGELVRTGRVLAAEFVNKGKVLRGIAYGEEGHEGYYSPDGRSLHKAFLRSPLEFTRISSGFSLARMHPILNTMRAHKGVDYAAPTGTKVKAVADATVSFAGKQGGYGNMIVLDHHNGINTVYGHLSRFAPETIRGHSVHQGDVIGFVGMTGLATGPHLHYEFRVHGEHRDPVTVALPGAVPLEASQRAAFSAHAQPLLSQLDLLRDTDLAALE